MAIPLALAGLVAPLFDLVDDLFTSDEEREAAKLKILKMQQTGDLETLQIKMSAILAEAQSADPWTSRARPSFLYVVYFFILMAVPMGALFAFSPTASADVTDGVTRWLAAIPEPMWYLFGTGYLGYTGARTIDKIKGVAK